MKQRGEHDQRPFGNFGFPGESEILRAVEVTIVVHDDIIPWRYPAKRELQFGEWQRNDILCRYLRASHDRH